MVWHTVDQDDSGEIDIEEFMHFVEGTKSFRASAYGGKDPFGHIMKAAAPLVAPEQEQNEEKEEEQQEELEQEQEQALELQEQEKPATPPPVNAPR